MKKYLIITLLILNAACIYSQGTKQREMLLGQNTESQTEEEECGKFRPGIRIGLMNLSTSGFNYYASVSLIKNDFAVSAGPIFGQGKIRYNPATYNQYREFMLKGVTLDLSYAIKHFKKADVSITLKTNYLREITLTQNIDNYWFDDGIRGHGVYIIPGIQFNYNFTKNLFASAIVNSGVRYYQNTVRTYYYDGSYHDWFNEWTSFIFVFGFQVGYNF